MQRETQRHEVPWLVPRTVPRRVAVVNSDASRERRWRADRKLCGGWHLTGTGSDRKVTQKAVVLAEDVMVLAGASVDLTP